MNSSNLLRSFRVVIFGVYTKAERNRFRIIKRPIKEDHRDCSIPRCARFISYSTQIRRFSSGQRWISDIRTAVHIYREAESVGNAIWTDTPPPGRFEALMLPW